MRKINKKNLWKWQNWGYLAKDVLEMEGDIRRQYLGA
jgi:hypothetical protein